MEEELKDKPSRQEMLEMLSQMIKSYDNLPTHILYEPVNHYDLYSALVLVSEILRS